MKIHFQASEDADQALLPPKRASAGAAGYDLCANLKAPKILEAGEIALIPTGLMIALPAGVEAQIRPRSGLAIWHGVSVVNAPGTIDWDYRGEIKIGLVNFSRKAFEIRHGMRIAQMVFAPVLLPYFEEGRLEESERGSSGFGSTGVL